MRRAAVLGHPIDHSLSPRLHTAAYSQLGLVDWRYDRHDVTEDALAGFLDRMDDSWAGLSLTMPLKRAVLPLLDAIDPVALATGAVNTVTLHPDGPRRRGANTDVHGIVTALRESSRREAAVGVPAPGGVPVVLGAGATAASAIAALAELGYVEAVVIARSAARAQAPTDAADAVGVRLRIRGWHEAADLIRRAPVVVATSPAGSTDDLTHDLRTTGAVAGTLLDVVYDPWPTPLAAAWRDGGGTVVPGIWMLIHQAVEQVRLMTGRTPDARALAAALGPVAGLTA